MAAMQLIAAMNFVSYQNRTTPFMYPAGGWASYSMPVASSVKGIVCDII